MSGNSFRSLVLIAILSGLFCFVSPFLIPQHAFSEPPKAPTSISPEEAAVLRGEMAELRKEIAASKELQKSVLKTTEKVAEIASSEAQWANKVVNTGYIVFGLLIAGGTLFAAVFTLFYRGALRGVAKSAEERAIRKIEVAREQSARFSELIVTGMQRIQDELYEWAVEAFSKALAIDYKSALAWNGKGWALSRLGDHEGALEALEEALKWDPEYVLPLYNMARVYSLQDKKYEMLDALKRTFELDPKFKERAKTEPELFNHLNDTDFRALVFDEEPTDEEAV